MILLVGDNNPTKRVPIMTLLLIAANIYCWFMLQGRTIFELLYIFDGGMVTDFFIKSVYTFGLIPGELLQTIEKGTTVVISERLRYTFDGASNWSSLVTAMFMHGGWLHLGGNMMFLWVFGDNVEDVMGPFKFLLFYLLCGLVASSAHVISAPSSVVPMVGASGAIGGVMGAYFLLYPGAQVRFLVPIFFVFFIMFHLPSFVVLGYWFFVQLDSGMPEFRNHEAGGVAYWAHIGGFVAGLLMVRWFSTKERLREARYKRYEPLPWLDFFSIFSLFSKLRR